MPRSLKVSSDVLQPLIYWSSTLTSDIQQRHKAGAKLQHAYTRINVVRMRQVMVEKGTSSQHVAVTKVRQRLCCEGLYTRFARQRNYKTEDVPYRDFSTASASRILTHTLHVCSMTCKHLLLSIKFLSYRCDRKKIMMVLLPFSTVDYLRPRKYTFHLV